MEIIWGDLCTKADSIPSPPWHKKVLQERGDKIKQGDEDFADWSSAKKDIGDNLS